MKFSKTRLVKSPSRGTSHSAGIDFYIPKFDDSFVKEILNKNPNLTTWKDYGNDIDCGSYDMCSTPRSFISDYSISLIPHDRIIIPSGIYINLDDEYEKLKSFVGDIDGICLSLNAFNKSGVSSKKGLDVLSCIVDFDYQGEIYLNLCNTTEHQVSIREDEKIIQFLIQPVFIPNPTEVELKDLYAKKSERGEGLFGSTGI